MQRATTPEATQRDDNITTVYFCQPLQSGSTVSFWAILALKKGVYLAGCLRDHAIACVADLVCQQSFQASPAMKGRPQEAAGREATGRSQPSGNDARRGSVVQERSPITTDCRRAQWRANEDYSQCRAGRDVVGWWRGDGRKRGEGRKPVLELKFEQFLQQRCCARARRQQLLRERLLRALYRSANL
jgi:hypothetical protein